MTIKGQKILLTGGAGFIGSSIAERLIKDNRVVILDNFHRNALQYTNFSKHKNLTVVRGDVLDAATVQKAMKGCNMVVHLASIAGVDTVLSMPVKTMEVAIFGTVNILKTAAQQKRMDRVIDFSTSEVCGRFAYQAKESDATTLGTVGQARWTYAVSKLATEHFALNYYKEHGLPVAVIRPFNIYGPRQVGAGAVHTFIKRAIGNQTLYIHNDGSQIRSWCYIDDIVNGVMLCLGKKDAVGHTFNIGNPRSTITIYNLAAEIVRLSKSKSKILFQKKDTEDVELRVPHIEKARDILGYEPKIDLEEGLLRTIDWYRKN